ncbi:MAG: hypothetical protein LBL26_14455 [Peptococcaceae bacterium]|nr:hypothetical protein [Peptococcaceae bacterium]
MAADASRRAKWRVITFISMKYPFIKAQTWINAKGISTSKQVCRIKASRFIMINNIPAAPINRAAHAGTRPPVTMTML